MSEQPAGWRSVPLRDAGTWFSGGTPYTDEPLYWNGDIPWISAASLKDFHINRSDRCVTETGANAGTKLVPSGTVLFVVRGMSLKKEFRVGVTGRKVAFGQDCKAILPAPGIDGRFLALALKARSRQILGMVDEAGHGTGRLPTDLIAKLLVDIPAQAEQQRIVEIVEAIDAQDVAIFAEIEKRRQIQLANVSELSGRYFALSEMAELSSLSSVITSGSRGWAEYYSNHGALFIRIGNLTREHINLRLDDRVYVHPPSGSEGSRTVLMSGDLLVSITADLGIIGVVPNHLGEAYINQHVALIRLLPDINSRWVGYMLSSLDGQRQFALANDSGAKAGLNLPAIGRVRVPVPDRTIQDRLANFLDEGYNAIRRLEGERSKLNLVKKGLMDDLLTGRVRVTSVSL